MGCSRMLPLSQRPAPKCAAARPVRKESRASCEYADAAKRLPGSCVKPFCRSRLFFFEAEEGASYPTDALWLALPTFPSSNRRFWAKSENSFALGA